MELCRAGASDARALVLEHAGDAPLVEGVTIRQLRRKRTLKTGTTRVELSLDEVDVVTKGRIATSFVELEAELLKGDESALDDVAQVFDDEPGLTRSTLSKLEAALEAVDGNGPIAALQELVEEGVDTDGSADGADGADVEVAAEATDAKGAADAAEASGEDGPRSSSM